METLKVYQSTISFSTEKSVVIDEGKCLSTKNFVEINSYPNSFEYFLK